MLNILLCMSHAVSDLSLEYTLPLTVCLVAAVLSLIIGYQISEQC